MCQEGCQFEVADTCHVLSVYSTGGSRCRSKKSRYRLGETHVLSDDSIMLHLQHIVTVAWIHCYFSGDLWLDAMYINHAASILVTWWTKKRTCDVFVSLRKRACGAFALNNLCGSKATCVLTTMGVQMGLRKV